ARGYEIIRAEAMLVRDQISTFASSAVVIGCAGAAFANTLYCPPGAVIVEIKPERMGSLWVSSICLLMGLKWAPYFCDSRPPDDPVVHGGKVRPSIGISFDVDLADFIAYLDRVTEEDSSPF
ncbi:MAG: glycosyltransferase 61 family protein, partial [bacterium]